MKNLLFVAVALSVFTVTSLQSSAQGINSIPDLNLAGEGIVYYPSNIKPKGFTRGFHIELEPSWFKINGIDHNALQGSVRLNDPQLKNLIYGILKESKLDNSAGSLAINMLLVELLNKAAVGEYRPALQKPQWVYQLRELFNDYPAYHWTLSELAEQLSIHPIHLSRAFPSYFNCGLGDYIRAIKIQKALTMLVLKKTSLTTIALECGFADQSHFSRSFKSMYQISPLTFRKLLV